MKTELHTSFIHLADRRVAQVEHENNGRFRILRVSDSADELNLGDFPFQVGVKFDGDPLCLPLPPDIGATLDVDVTSGITDETVKIGTVISAAEAYRKACWAIHDLERPPISLAISAGLAMKKPGMIDAMVRPSPTNIDEAESLCPVDVEQLCINALSIRDHLVRGTTRSGKTKWMYEDRDRGVTTISFIPNPHGWDKLFRAIRTRRDKLSPT